jgi:hypothetical protein
MMNKVAVGEGLTERNANVKGWTDNTRVKISLKKSLINLRKACEVTATKTERSTDASEAAWPHNTAVVRVPYRFVRAMKQPRNTARDDCSSKARKCHITTWTHSIRHRPQRRTGQCFQHYNTPHFKATNLFLHTNASTAASNVLRNPRSRIKISAHWSRTLAQNFRGFSQSFQTNALTLPSTRHASFNIQYNLLFSHHSSIWLYAV